MTPDVPRKYLRIIAGAGIGVILLAALIALYFQRRGPVGGRSDYRQVNDRTVRDWIVMETKYPDYAPDTEVIEIAITNYSAAEPLTPASDRKDEWVLEIYVNGEWRTVRHTGKKLCWDFDRALYGQEDYGEGIRPSGTVPGGGGDLSYLCDIWAYYDLPLTAGQYRIIFPDMLLGAAHNLAVEFAIRDLTPEEEEERRALEEAEAAAENPDRTDQTEIEIET